MDIYVTDDHYLVILDRRGTPAWMKVHYPSFPRRY